MAPRMSRCTATLRPTCSSTPVLPFLSRQWLQRAFHGSSILLQDEDKSKVPASKYNEVLDSWRKYSSAFPVNKSENVHYGFLRPRRNVSKHLSFADLVTPSGERIQICSTSEHDPDAHAAFRQIPKHAPVMIRARTDAKAVEGHEADQSEGGRRTLHLDHIEPLNSMSSKLIITDDVVFPPEKRFLQLRFHPEAQARLEFRSWLKNKLSQSLLEEGFMDIETPTLFKSTPEGAREFLVPVRKGKGKSKAYALSQSPQQYKQALIGSGIMRYMQWARCYRDEDARTDRQPEFTQLDMEWAFAGAEQVQKDINDIILNALAALRPSVTYNDVRGQRVPLVRKLAEVEPTAEEPAAHQFSTMTFAECLEKYGSDKPDLRIPGRIHGMKDLDSISSFVGMITHLPDPKIEAFALPLNGASPDDVRKVVIKFMDELPEAFKVNPDGMPQVLVYDTKKPLAGMSSIGHEYESVLEQIAPGHEFDNGDVIVFQAREKVQGQETSASTMLGDARKLLWKALVDADLMETPNLGEPGSLQFLWVTEFPMFKAVEENEPGQGSKRGIAAAHHPFTAPLSEKDLELLAMGDPTQARSAAYDLVLNGVEIGGGSVRNHVASIQRFIMTDVLQMTPEAVSQFDHLFEVLESGCPPHAGFALGFDRMVALMSGTSTVRDVIAFPKTMKGEDLFVKSPSKLTNEQLAPYDLRLGRSK